MNDRNTRNGRAKRPTTPTEKLEGNRFFVPHNVSRVINIKNSKACPLNPYSTLKESKQNLKTGSYLNQIANRHSPRFTEMNVLGLTIKKTVSFLNQFRGYL